MDGWLDIVLLVVGFLAVVAICLVLLAVRRRWIDRPGGTFECSLRLDPSTPGAGWAIGVGRYSEGSLQWYRFFSYSPRPRKQFVRDGLRVVQTRDPDPIEAVALDRDQRVVRVATRGGTPEEWELAMSPDSVTGLLAWLEAAPPGARRAD